MGDINDNYPEDEACNQAGMNWEANDNSDQMIDTTSGAEDAVLDLVELEQLHEESERMKGLGNKHMAAQEFTRAYNAYSAALQLSPVGPSSHVFLSNRAASLLSLKRYSAAAVDARRAVALAPTFGKAYARLGQALYFLRQYKGAVEAYQDALKFEQEDNHSLSNAVTVTRAYLQKAKEKLAKHEEKELRKYERGAMVMDDNTVVGDESVNPTVAYSIATDKKRVGVASGMNRLSRRVSAAADAQLDMGSPQLRDLSFQEDELIAGQDLARNSLSSPYLMTVETRPMGGLAQQRVEQPELQDVRLKTFTPITALNHENTPANDYRKMSKMDEPDPDFDEALRLQCRATHFLNSRKFNAAVDEFSAALFLVPDDSILTPQLHVGRAYALNGQERFESAKNDALMALKHILRDRDEDVSAAEAYSVLGRSLYYSHDYYGSIESFEESQRIRINYGVKLSVIDKEYVDLCREALDAGLSVENDDGLSFGGGKSVMSNGVKSVVSCIKEGRNISNIPRLKPPRFVPREKAIHSVPNVPPMPKDWPLQSPTSPSSIATGPERPVIFFTDAMGIKLNRGSDGLVRVLSVAKLPPGSPILRKGELDVGDLVREAGGVDLRRPITAVMWGDTVALIKISPRPLQMIVAKELTAEVVRGTTTLAEI